MDVVPKEFIVAESVVTTCGIAANLVVLFIFYKRKDVRQPWNIVNIPHNISEILFSTVIFIGNMDTLFFSFRGHTWRCTTQGILTVISGSFSCFSIVLIAWERFRAICHAKIWQMKVWLFGTVTVFIYATLVAILPLFDPLGFVFNSVGNCIVPWYGTSWILRLTSILSLFNLCGASILIAYLYYCIFRYYHLIQSQRSSLRMKASTTLPSPENAVVGKNTDLPDDKDYEKKQKELQYQIKSDRQMLIKASCYILTFAILWTPYIILILVELLTESPANQGFHMFATIISEASAVVNPLVFIFLTPSFLAEIKSWGF